MLHTCKLVFIKGLTQATYEAPYSYKENYFDHFINEIYDIML